MSERTAMFVFVVGLIVTFGAAGGVEAAETTAAVIDSVIVAAVGLLMMWVSTLSFGSSQ